ncbi:pathogen-related protein-like [Impatiens glandulifera]|uniref:pathogen-related protein-like n=1 Tax=Impatiens glandulifera TaxID=253017 RepID=UPI001FB0850D|nr:pathogen-related protein-like [Impatiens glandulifera]
MAVSIVVEEDKYRSHLYGDGEKNTKWRFGAAPNYEAVNKLFEEGRTKIWPVGSLEEKVQNLVKTWEMEMFNKLDYDDYKTVDTINFKFSLNGSKPVNLEDMHRVLGGGYNAFMQTSLPQNLRCYDPDEETVESAHLAFITAFTRGFALEVLQVYSGPPVIVYKFRHWGFMEGPFKGHAPTGEKVELFGMAVFELDEKERIVKVEFFFDRGELLGRLVTKGGDDNLQGEISSSCPFLKNIS